MDIIAPVATIMNNPSKPQTIWRFPMVLASSFSAPIIISTTPQIKTTVAATIKKVMMGLMMLVLMPEISVPALAALVAAFAILI